MELQPTNISQLSGAHKRVLLKKLLERENLTKEHYGMAYKELKNKCNIYIKGALKRNKEDEVQYYRNLISKLKIDKANA